MSWLDKFKANLLEILYRQDQCRVPAGSPEGGQFTSCGPSGGSPQVYEWALNRFGDEQTAKNFTEWFGDSKVVDGEGNPLVVYHGTAFGGFEEFGLDHAGKRGDPGLQGQGFYFTEQEGLAKGYSEHPVYKDAITGEKVPESELSRQVYPAYLAAENLYDANSDPLGIEGRLSGREYAKTVKDAGYDGVRLVLPDGFNVDYVVFNPTQIKSATGNIGSFDPDSPNITLRKKETT